MLLLDAHIHLDFVDDASGLAFFAAQQELSLFANTVSPYGFMKLRMRYPGNPWIVPGLGFHPWWVADDVLQPADLELFEMLAAEAAFVGEIGLDFMGARKKTAVNQLDAFDRIIESCMGPLVVPPASDEFQRVISIHAVKATSEALDVLERWDATSNNACVFHWFTGSSDELQRATKMGCYFSVSPRMLRSKKGQAYVRAIPADRLLLETDAPGRIEPASWDSVVYSGVAPVPDPRVASYSCEQWVESLEQTASQLQGFVGKPLPRIPRLCGGRTLCGGDSR